MDFKKIKEKILQAKNKTVEYAKKANDWIIEKLKKSKLVLKTNEDLKKFIETSKNKIYINSEWEEKESIRRSIIFFIDFSKTKSITIFTPILLTKWFSWNAKIAFVDTENKDIDYSFLNLEEFPCISLFENENNIKNIYWEENIKKVVKSLNLDITRTIDEL